MQVIYVGPLERVTYGQRSLAKFDEAVGNGGLEVLYDAGGVTIYGYAGGRWHVRRTIRKEKLHMPLEATIVRIERGVMRRLPPGLVMAGNARVHRMIGEPELRELPRLVAPGSLAIDVGAHFGMYAHALARLVGKSGKVIAVEPVAEDAAFLREAVRQLRLPVTVCECALSAKNGEAELHVPVLHGKEKTALASLEVHDAGGETRTVVTKTLDDLLEGETLPVSFVKIDVEGHESAVLEGARETIANHKPNLLIEIEGRFHDQPALRVIEQVLALGYRGEFLNATGQRRPVSSFDPAVYQDPALDPLDKRYIRNFLFTPE